MANIMRLGGGSGGGTTIGVSYNADGTQNLTILDKGKIVEEPPILLWTNPNPTSSFAAQTVTLPTGYSGYIVEYREDTNNAAYSKAFIEFSAETQASVGGAVRNSSLRAFGRQINSAKDGEIQFGLGLGAVFGGGTGSGNAGDGIPTRIWGLKYAV